MRPQTLDRLGKLATLALAGWALVLLFLLSERPTAALAGCLFFVGIFVPAMLCLRATLARLGIGAPLDTLVGAALAWMVLTLLFVLRGLTGIPAGLFDTVLAVALWIAAWLSLPAGGLSGLLSRWNHSAGRRADLWWALLWLPILFLAVRSGYEVKVGDEVHYYGLNFVDFGNLVAVVNLLNASPGLPLQAVEGGGPLSYHWLFFAVPAWMASFAGIETSASGALTLATFAGALLFYKTLSRACAVALQETGRSQEPWCGWGAGIGIFALTIFSIYMFVAGRLDFKWASGGGLRNHLLLQLPNSVNVFGNNTLALTMILLAVLSLVSWNRTGRVVYAGLAALLVAFVPALSATMLPAVAGGFVLAALCGAIRKPILVLGTCGVVGAALLALFWSMGLFSGRAETSFVEFDGGLYLRNIVGSTPLCVAALVWCLAKARSDITWLLAGLMAGAFLLPTLLDLRGGMGSGAHLSMKNFSLLVCASAPLVAVMVVDAAKLWRRRIGPGLFILFFVGMGLINSIGYAVSYPWRVLAKTQPAVTLDADLYEALLLARSMSSPGEIVANPLGDDLGSGNPTTTVAGRRSLLPNKYSREHTVESPEITQRVDRWNTWSAAGYPAGDLSAEFANMTDLVLIDRELPPDDWRQAAVFGKVRVYASRHRSPQRNDPENR